MDFKKFFTHRVIANSVWFLGTTLTAYLILTGAKFVSFENRNLEFGAIIFILFIIFSSKHILKKMIAKEGEIEAAVEQLGEKTNKIIKAPTNKQSGLET
jgi:membrane protein DedA with SNARE-associated domain